MLALLSEQDQETIRPYVKSNAGGVHETVKEVLATANQARDVCQEKRWTTTFCGQPVVLRDKVDSIVKWLDRLKQIGDAAANVDPLHIGLPWAGIRLLLQVSDGAMTIEQEEGEMVVELT